MKLPIPTDWDGEHWCDFAVCWPDSESWRAILRGFITLPQRGRTWDERTGSILSVQEIGREISARNLPEKECIMPCSDDVAQALLEGLQAIANATSNATAIARASGCCEDRTIDSSGGFQGTVDTEGGTVPIYGSVPPKGLEPGQSFPPEFENQAQFDAHKCSIAYAIFDGVLLTVNFLAGVNLANITGLAAVIGAGIAGIIIFPPAAIPVMIGALLALAGFMGMFIQIRLSMLEQKQDFICAMYNSASTNEAISVIADLLDVIILAITTTGPIALALKTVLLLLFNSDTLNQLYETSVDVLYPDADCTDCCQPCQGGDPYEIDLSSGWSIDDSHAQDCFRELNLGNPTMAQGATLDLSVSNPGQWKFLTVFQPVEPFSMVYTTVRVEFQVQSEAVSFFWGVVFDDDTCNSEGGGFLEVGDTSLEQPLDQANLCKTVIGFIFHLAASFQYEPATISVTSAQLLCQEELNP